MPAAPTEASILFDLVVGASSIYAGSWLEGGGAVFAENEALRWIADLAGLPPEAGGVFVSGGTAGNLSALIAARWIWRHDADGALDRTRGLWSRRRAPTRRSPRPLGRWTPTSCSCRPTTQGACTASALAETVDALSADDRDRLFAIVATSGTTNAGVIDDLAGAADACERYGVWFHVDGAYGGAALAAPRVRHRFAGIERADSFIVDPHKWLFAPFDCCALLYRDPRIAKAAHTQHAEYLDVLHDDDDAWNASDYAHHLSRRARGLPLWFSLATYGTDAYRDAVETTLSVAHAGAEADPCQRRTSSWSSSPSCRWWCSGGSVGRPTSTTRGATPSWPQQTAFVVPTAWQGETVLRYCVVNPLTTVDDLAAIVTSLA